MKPSSILMCVVVLLVCLTLLMSTGTSIGNSTASSSMNVDALLPLIMIDYLPPTSTPTPTRTPTPTPTRTPTPTPSPTPTPLPHCIYQGGSLCGGYDMGVDDSAQQRNWIRNVEDYIRMEYPGGLTWGAVFITFGPPRNPPRPGQNLSQYSHISMELRTVSSTACVRVGIKDNTDPDNGSEAKIRQCIPNRQWETFTFPLPAFATADLTRLYVVTEFVFELEDAGQPHTVEFRNIIYR